MDDKQRTEKPQSYPPGAIDIAMATELWETVEHMALGPEPTVRESEIAIMARVIAAARAIGRAEGRRECVDGK